MVNANSTNKTLLVVGGSVAGCVTITSFRKLDTKTKIVLVEPKDFVEFAWGTYRTPLDAKLAQKSLCPLDSFCKDKKVQHVRSIVTKLTTEMATLADGTEISFDACCICTGAGMYWDGHGRSNVAVQSATERLAQLKAAGDKLKSAKSVLIVGGGLVGSELAGDVVEYCKNVTLVHSGERLCPEMIPKASAAVQAQLKKRGVRIVLGAKASKNESQGKWTLSTTGETLDAKEVVLTVGLKARNSYLDAKHLDENAKWIATDDSFCVKNGSGRLFSLGDCNTVSPNSSNFILNNGPVIAHNIVQGLQAGGSSSFKSAVQPPKVIICTTGPSSGIAQVNGSWTRIFLPWLKNKTMFYFNFTKECGLKSMKSDRTTSASSPSSVVKPVVQEENQTDLTANAGEEHFV